LICFRVDISQKEKSTVVLAAVEFLFYKALLVVTYPPNPFPLGIYKGKGKNFREGLRPSFITSLSCVL